MWRLSINDFAWPIINESGNTSLDGNDGTGEFIEWFKGLLITTNNTSPATNEGCIFYTDLLSSNSKISLFYRDTSGTAADHDTIQFDFNLNANCARFHNIAMDNGNSPLGDQLLDSTLGQEIFFVQSLGGAKVIGPLLIGLGQPIEIAPLRSSTSGCISPSNLKLTSLFFKISTASLICFVLLVNGCP